MEFVSVVVELVGRETSTYAPNNEIGELLCALPVPAAEDGFKVTGNVVGPVVETVSAAVDDTDGGQGLNFESDLSIEPCCVTFSAPPLSLTRLKC